MKSDTILEFIDGKREEAMLVGDFVPEQNVIKTISATSGAAHTFFLNKLCCVLMIPKADLKFDDKTYRYEKITTVAGKQYHVAILEDQKYPTGFYGFSTDTNNPYKLIFFTAGGVKARQQENPVGSLLKDKGFVTDFEVERALNEQKDLRGRRLGEILARREDVPHASIERAIENAFTKGKVTARTKVGDILVEAGLVTKEQVENAIDSQEEGKKKRIGSLLIDKGLITEKQLLTVLAAKFLLRFVDLETIVPAKETLAALPLDIIHELRLFPIEDDGRKLVVATSEPADYTIPDSLRFYTNRKVQLVVATSKQISDAVSKYYPKKEYKVEDIISGMTDKVDIELETEEIDISESDSQIVSLVNRILLDGYNKGASDIHFEPGYRDQPFQVRYRIDGLCSIMHEVPKTHKRAIISRIKIMSNLDIAERRKPQSGKIVVWHQGRQIEYRVEVTPTVGANEDAVLRVLASTEPLPLEQMAFSAANLESMKEILGQSYGIILCVGPTGSGKTTTLHSALKAINTPEKKIWTIEDPVEITQRGLRQVQVLPKIGLTFHEALRSFLRADPDIIMIGEMRDEETAKTAIEASLTGHLVLSTLHTNSAPETIVRLIDMGMDPFNFADALLGVLAQRLARRLCEKCKESYQPDKEEYDRLVEIYGIDWFRAHDGIAYSPGLTLKKKVGCETCNGSGYKGRIAVHELLISREAIKQLIRHKAPVDQLRGAAMAQGMRTLLMDGIHKVFQGFTDLTEILQVARYEKSFPQSQEANPTPPSPGQAIDSV
jgi:type II secretory ATPase GspE/PulE/Tfp pilus assembly ATPase PilB-like protein